MDFRIADTFTESLARLTGEEQKAVKTTAFDLQVNPANPGLSFHKLDDARDKNFWSVRASGDIRLIVHRSSASLLLCYVDHHDHAYSWAERRRLETHPQTGAAQLVEIRERVEEIAVPRYVEVAPSAPPKPALFAQRSDAQLLGYGVPTEWLADVRQATEESLLELVGHLPAEAAEALLFRDAGERAADQAAAPDQQRAAPGRTPGNPGLASDLANRRQRPFDFVVVDEAQDISVPQLRFLAAVGAWIAERVQEGVAPHEIGVFVRSAAELDRGRAAVAGSGFPFKMLDDHMETSHGHLCVGTMHLAKGLEFRAVVVMACDDEIIPLQARIETVTDDSDLDEVYNTERHLLYVACTRARDHLLVSGVEPASEFLDDLQTLCRP